MSWGDPNNPQNAPGQAGGDGIIFALAGLVVLVFSLSWVLWLAGALAALLAGHGWQGGSAGHALPFAASLLGGHSMAVAWAHVHAGGSGPVWLFWPLAVLLLAAVLVPAVVLLVRYRNRNRPDMGAQWARRGEEKRMVVPEDYRERPNRLVAGHSETTNRLLAGADCTSAIAFGPNGSGKTVSLVVPAALEWQGPIAVSTAKGPDLDYMLTARQQMGPVHIVAPVGLPGRKTSCWSPVAYATDPASAARMARWLADAVAMDDPASKPWVTQARQFLGPVLLAANLSGGGVDALVDFVQRGKGSEQEVRSVLSGSQYARFLRQYTSIWTNLHADGIGSVLFTANNVIDPYLDPIIRASAVRSDFTAEDILFGDGSLFLVSPPSESKALSPLFTACLATLVYAIEREFDRLNVGGGPGVPPKPLPRRVLFDLDEAGNVFKYSGLAQLSTTSRAMGLQLFTIWHDLSQLESLYGEKDAQTILSQAKLRMVLPGMGDKDSLEHFSEALGNTVRRRSSVTNASDGRGSTTSNQHESPLMAPWQIRQLVIGHALVQYDNLPPMKVKMRNAETDKRLLALGNGRGLLPAQPSRPVGSVTR